jgi:UDPglucose--hexose-1-phosphate uridylyltransferase
MMALSVIQSPPVVASEMGARVSKARDDTGGRRGRLVWNALWGEYGVQTPARMTRREGTADCPFCADLTAGRVPPDARVWIRPNDFPALQPPAGECYVLIYSRDHDRRFSQLALDEALEVVGLWRTVYEELAPRYPVVMTWETSGAEIGQTQRHPHGQTYAVSVTPDLLHRELDAVAEAERHGRRCPFCERVSTETRGERLVYDGAGWVGYVPEWARYPYQIQLVARRHIATIADIGSDGAEARELAEWLPRLIRAWDQAYAAPMPYMLALHQHADPRYHFHIELLPVGRAPGKLKLAASAEMAWGLWLNDALPEDKAAELRRLLGGVDA